MIGIPFISIQADKIPNKSECHFIQFDVENFYPSISKRLLEETIEWASTFTNIEEKTKEIIFHVRKTFLFYQGEAYVKKNSPDFDVPQGSFDSAEVCELVGLYILSKLNNLPAGIISALYRDDGIVLSRLSRQETENVKKRICAIFRELGLKITVSANRKIIDFLDVNLNLNTGEYKQFRKEGDTPCYVHIQSNHPPSILKNIPKNVNHRLNIISSNERVFNEAKPMYQDALNASGYKHDLTYEKIDIHSMNNKNSEKKKNRSRKRRIFWFNPPWDSRVASDVGAKFLRILDKTIPRGHPLYKLFNRHTVKVSYRCLGNLGKKISVHNQRIFSEYTAEKKRVQQHQDNWNCHVQQQQRQS